MNTNESSTRTDTILASLGAIDEESTLQTSSALGALPAAVVDNIRSHSSSGNSGLTSNVEDRALSLLGAGVQAEAVASALGVTPSRIAQLLSEKHFATKVSELRYENLQKHNVRDSQYDSLEDRLLAKLDKALPLLIKPESILKAITIVNGAKRRGQSAPTQVTNQQNIVNLVLPAIITEKFAVNLDNQVIKAGEQELLTMASGNLLKRVEEAEELRTLEHTGELNDV